MTQNIQRVTVSDDQLERDSCTTGWMGEELEAPNQNHNLNQRVFKKIAISAAQASPPPALTAPSQVKQ